MTIRALIPSYRPDPEQLGRLVQSLQQAGASTVVLANGQSAFDAADAGGFEVLAPGVNSGFGPSIAWAVEQLPEWTWLLLANDDLDVDGAALGQVLARLPQDAGALIVHLEEDVARPLPDARSVFSNISLLARILERLAPKASDQGSSYRSFSCVAISQKAWHVTDGFDTRMPFTYEDADFVRRLLAAGGEIRVEHDTGIHHEGSTSSSRAVRAVLPVVVWSAFIYLQKWSSMSRTSIRVLLAAALLVRAALVPFGRADRRAHFAGVRRSLLVVIKQRRPALPPYESLV